MVEERSMSWRPPTPRWRPGLRLKLTAPIALTVVLTGAALTTVEYRTGRASLQDQLAKRGAQFARDLALSARLGLLSDDRPSLQELAALSAREPDVLYVAFAAAGGEVVARTHGAPPRVARPRAVEHDARPRLTLRVRGTRRWYEVLAPVLVERSAERSTEDGLFQLERGGAAGPPGSQEVVGFVQVALSFEETDRRVQAALLQGVLLAGLWGLMGIAAAAAGAGVVTRRLRHVMQVSRRMAAGDLDVRVPAAAAGDELNDLALHFNRMADALAQRDEIFRANEELRAQNLSIQRASALKSAFLATMSHELRTPLTAILGFTRLVLRKSAADLPERQQENLRKVESSALGLLDLINSILDLSKIEAGHMALTTEQVDLAVLARAVVEGLAPLAQAKSLGLRTIVEASPPPTWTDATRVRQILTNLVSNAIKFTHQGEVTLTVRYDREHDRYVLAVRDTGVGIPPLERERIFEPFHQVDASSTRSFAGTGLGLAIVRDLSALLGGAIEVDSELGVGSTFTVVLPRAAAPVVAPPPATTSPSDGGTSADVA